MTNEREVQLARAALQLLGRASVQMGELDVAVAVRNWLMGIAREQAVPLNGAEAPRPEADA